MCAGAEQSSDSFPNAVAGRVDDSDETQEHQVCPLVAVGEGEHCSDTQHSVQTINSRPTDEYIHTQSATIFTYSKLLYQMCALLQFFFSSDFFGEIPTIAIKWYLKDNPNNFHFGHSVFKTRRLTLPTTTE